MTHPTNPQTIADRRRLDVRSCSRLRPAYAAAMRATPGKSALKATHPKMPALSGPSGPSTFRAPARTQMRFAASRMAQASHSRVAESPRDRSKFLLYDKLRSFPGPPDSGTASKEFWLQGAWATISRTRAVREAILYRRRRVLDLSRRGRWRACRVSQSLVRHAVHPIQASIGAVYFLTGRFFVGGWCGGPKGGVASPPRAPPGEEDPGPHPAAGRARDQGRGRGAPHVEPPVPEAEGHLGAAQRRFHVVPDDGSDAPRILRIEVEADLERERGRAQGRIQPVVAVARVDVGRSTFMEHLVSVRVRHLDGEVTESVVVRGRQSRVRPGIENPLSGAVI